MSIPARSAVRALACAASLALVLASCGKKSPVAPVVTAPISLETGRAATALIGTAGGELVAHGASGIEYRLNVPSGALASATSITLTPVESFEHLPLSGGLAGAVDVQPAGLAFARAATLEITTSAQPPAGKVLAAVTAKHDGSGFALTPVYAIDGLIRIPVARFPVAGGIPARGSGARAVAAADQTVLGAGFGSSQDLAALVVEGNASNAAFLSRLAVAVSDHADPNALASIFHDWFVQAILPGIQDATTDERLVQACGDFTFWKLQQLESHATPLPGDESAGRAALAPQLRSAFDGDNTRMAAQQDFAALANCLYWRDQAAFFEVATLANRLDAETLRRDLKLRFDFGEPIGLPNPMQVGFPNTFEVPIGVIFEGHGSEVTPAHFFCEMSAIGADVEIVSGRTGVFPNSSREGYASGLTARTNGQVLVTLKASIVPVVAVAQDGSVSAEVSDVSETHEYTLSGLDVTGTWTGSFTDQRTDDATGAQTTFTVAFVAQFDQTQNHVSGTWHADDGEGGILFSGTVTATLSGATLLNWTMSQNVPNSGTFTGGATVSGDGNHISTQFTGTTPTASHVGTSSLARGGVLAAAAANRRR